MNRLQVTIDSVACCELQVPHGGYHDRAEMVMFCREALEEGLPRYHRHNGKGYSVAACLLVMAREIVQLASDGVRDSRAEGELVSSYMRHNSCFDRMSLLPEGWEIQKAASFSPVAA